MSGRRGSGSSKFLTYANLLPAMCSLWHAGVGRVEKQPSRRAGDSGQDALGWMPRGKGLPQAKYITINAW